MPPKRRRSLLITLAGSSLVLCLVPAAISQKARLTLLSVLRPLRNLGAEAAELFPSRESPELRNNIVYLEGALVKTRNENDRLTQLLAQTAALKEPVKERGFKLLHADIEMPADSSTWRKSVTITLGERGGARKGMLVVHHNHVVGRILAAGPWSSRVQLVTDPAFRARAVATPKSGASGVSFEQRHVGVYEGTAGDKGILKWIAGETPVETGASVLTTEDSLNGVPRGLILGLVTALSAGRGVFPRVDVEPVLNFRGLEQVTILVPPDAPGAAASAQR